MKCGVTNKVIFKTEAGALNRGMEISGEDSNRKFTPGRFRSYKCEYCGYFHLSGKFHYVDKTRF